MIADDYAHLTAWICIVLFEIHNPTLEDIQWYTSRQSKSSSSLPPSWIFPLVWYLLKALIIASQFIFFKNSPIDADWYMPAVYALSITTILLMKFWTVLFFRMRSPRVAIAISVLLVATSTATVTCIGVTGTQWVSFGLYMPLPIWLVVALVLNIKFRNEKGSRR